MINITGSALAEYPHKLITLVMVMPAVAHNHLGGLNLLSFDCHVVTCTKGSAKESPQPSAYEILSEQ